MDLTRRIDRLQELLQEQNIGAAYLFYSRDIFYYTGTAQPAYLAVWPDDYVLFVKNGYELACDDVFIDRQRLQPERRPETVLGILKSRLKVLRVATELDLMPARQFLEFQHHLAGCKLLDVSPLVLRQRQAKDQAELAHIHRACQAVDAGHHAVIAVLRAGITELELAAAVENAQRLAGHEGHIFIRRSDFFMSRGPLASGPNVLKFSGMVYSVTGVGLSPAVPIGPSRRRIETGDVVVVDIPTLVEGYHADQTRTYVVGAAAEPVKALYRRLQAVADHLIEIIRPGMSGGDIYQAALQQAEQLGVSAAFLRFGPGRKSRMIGHGVGLEVNEPPILAAYDNTVVGQDFVITLEMHLLDPDVGLVKLEDMIRIGRAKNEILTLSPRHLMEV